MQVFVYKNAEEVARAAATVFAAEIFKKPDCVLGLATGSTPVPLYKELARMNHEGLIDFSRVRTYNLDEYVGLDPAHVCSYRRFMNENLFDHIHIDKANTHVPCGIGADHEADAKAYDAAVEAAGGIDLQLLGIGHNGHIGFNEPCESFPAAVHPVELTESTIQANSRLFDRVEDVPTRAITMGIGTILKARRILLIAGADKREIVEKALTGPVTPWVPASVLQLHRDVTVITCGE